MMVEQNAQIVEQIASREYYASFTKSVLVDHVVKLAAYINTQQNELQNLQEENKQKNKKLALYKEMYDKVRRDHAKAISTSHHAQQDRKDIVRLYNDLTLRCTARDDTISDMIFLVDDVIDAYYDDVSTDMQKIFIHLIESLSEIEVNLYGTTKQRGTATRARNAASL